jgi:site-specific DNA-methyltransferase (adenine-specific)
MGVMHAALGRATLTICYGDSRELGWIAPGSVHLVLTSPPYWTLKEYPRREGQLGLVEDYDAFHDELDKVWKHCFRVLVPGGRLVCVVGDVCLSRRKHGRHSVMPMHADIIVRTRKVGFDNLTPILWHKITNASYEVENGSGFLGKPYEPNAIVKNDVEFILMLRKPGGYRQPTDEQREASRLTKQEHQEWFRQIWNGPRGESTRHHPAPFPEEPAHRLVRMFSFTGDTVLDPFMGTGTTLLASARCGRNAIGVEIEPAYVTMSKERIERDLGAIFRPATPARGMPGFPIRDDNAAAIGMASLTASAGRVSRSGGPAILTIPGSAGRLSVFSKSHDCGQVVAHHQLAHFGPGSPQGRAFFVPNP